MRGKVEASRSEPGGRRVLIVEDDLESAELLQELLHAEGYTVAIAHDGAQAISSALALHPEFVLLDIQLRSQLNGYDVCRQLAASLERPPRVLAMTGPLAPDEDQLRDAGFAGHIDKPILDPNQILQLLGGT